MPSRPCSARRSCSWWILLGFTGPGSPDAVLAPSPLDWVAPTAPRLVVLPLAAVAVLLAMGLAIRVLRSSRPEDEEC